MLEQQDVRMSLDLPLWFWTTSHLCEKLLFTGWVGTFWYEYQCLHYILNTRRKGNITQTDVLSAYSIYIMNCLRDPQCKVGDHCYIPRWKIETEEQRIIECLGRCQNKVECKRSTDINTLKSPVTIATENTGKQLSYPRVLRDKISLNVKSYYQALLELALEPQPAVIQCSSSKYTFHK